MRSISSPLAVTITIGTSEALRISRGRARPRRTASRPAGRGPALPADGLSRSTHERCRDLGLEPLAPKALGQGLRDCRFVLDHKDSAPHGSMLPVTFGPKGSERPSHSGMLGCLLVALVDRENRESERCPFERGDMYATIAAGEGGRSPSPTPTRSLAGMSPSRCTIERDLPEARPHAPRGGVQVRIPAGTSSTPPRSPNAWGRNDACPLGWPFRALAPSGRPSPLPTRGLVLV
jgi:hypothetical protein